MRTPSCVIIAIAEQLGPLWSEAVDSPYFGGIYTILVEEIEEKLTGCMKDLFDMEADDGKSN